VLIIAVIVTVTLLMPEHRFKSVRLSELGMNISKECTEGRHAECGIQIPAAAGTTNCQCDCHPGTMGGTFTGASKSVEDVKT
jgi:hypothetical protein